MKLKFTLLIAMLFVGAKLVDLEELLGDKNFQKAIERKLNDNTKLVFPFDQTEK